MNRLILTSVVVAALSIIASATAVDAAPGKGNIHVNRIAPAHVTHVAPAHVTHVAPLHVNHVTHTNLLVQGRYVNVPYRIAGYRGWSNRCWFPAYRTYGYYSPVDLLWYYWYAPQNQYLPVTYMSVYPPTQFAPPVGYAPNPMLPQGIAPPSGGTLIPGPITTAP